MAAATVTSHMATSAAVSATGGGPNGSGDNDVDCFVTTANEDLQVIAFSDGMRSVSTSPPPKLNCTSSVTATLSNVVENIAAAKSLVVLMMDSSTQTEAATNQENNQNEYQNLQGQDEIVTEFLNDNIIDKHIDLNLKNDKNDIVVNNVNVNDIINSDENIICVNNETGCDENEDDENHVCECEYEERIIDYDNFRIIEHIIDTRPLHKNRKKCRELANRVEIIDNRTNSCKIENKDRNDYFTGFTFISDKTSQLSVCDKIDNVENNIDDNDRQKKKVYEVKEENKQMDAVTNNQRVDDNNNTTQRNNVCDESVDCSIVSLTQVTEQNLDEISVCLSEHPQQQQQQQQQPQQQKPFKTRKVKSKQHQSLQVQQHQYRKQTTGEYDSTTTTKTPTLFSPLIALKAFQSKLTPLAPPFHPTGAMTTTTNVSTSTLTTTTNSVAASSTTTNTTAAVYAYERTTIFYQQQQQKQQQQQVHFQQHLQQDQRSHQINYSNKQLQQQTTPQTYKNHKKYIKQIQHKNYNNTQKQQRNQVALQTPTTTATTLGTPMLSTPAVGSIYPTLETGQIFPVQFIPLMSPMPPALSLLLGQQQQKQLQQQPGHSNVHGSSNDCNKIVQQQQTANIATMSTADGAWPLVEAPIFIDTNGEYCTYCPTHGTPLMAPPMSIPPVPGQLRPPRLLGAALQSLTQQQQQQHQHRQQHQQQHTKHIPIIGVTPSLQQQEQISNSAASTEGHNLLSISSANNSTGTSPSGSPSSTPNPTTLAGAGSVTTAVPLYFKLESGVTTLPLQIAGKSTVLRGK